MDVKIGISDRDMERIVDQARALSYRVFGESFIPGVAQVVEAELAQRGVESASQNDPDFLSRLAFALAEQLSEYGYGPVHMVFMGLGGHAHLDKMKKEQPQRYALLQNAVRESGALSCIVRGLPPEYFEADLIAIVDAVSWQVDCDTNPRTAARRC